MQTKTGGITISSKITAMVLIMVILSSVSIGVFSYLVYRNDSIRYQGQKALSAAAAMASIIDVAQFAYIAETEEHTDYYLQMKDIFTKANKHIGTLYLYAMVKDDDGIHYKYVFAAETDLNNPLLGGRDTIVSYGDYPLQAMERGEPVISDIYDNEGYGFLVSAFYPLFDTDGRVLGLVCADIKAGEVIDSINDYKGKVIIAVLVFVLLFGVISVSYSLRLFGKAKQTEQALHDAHNTILSGIEYSGKIQRNLLPSTEAFEQAFSDYAIIWKPRDIVGGDFYWLKNFKDGTLLCVCDCTGHGTPGALLTMFVASALESIVNATNYSDTANVIWMLDRKLGTVLNANAVGKDIKEGCDIAVLFISKSGDVHISAGNMRVLVCDGECVKQVKGQRLFVGEGKLHSKDDVKVVTLAACGNHKFYIASDGLYEQTGGENDLPLGYKNVTEMVLAHHHENQSAITENIWRRFEAHRGDAVRADDFALIAFTIKGE